MAKQVKTAAPATATPNNKSAAGSYYDGEFETIKYLEHVHTRLIENGVDPKRALNVTFALKYLSSRLGAKADSPVELDLQKAENYIHRARTRDWIDPEFLTPPKEGGKG